MIFGLRSIFEYDISFEEPKDTLARLISAGVRPIVAVSDKFRPIQKVLIAYSGSMESAKTMKRFVQLRLWPDAKIENRDVSGSKIRRINSYTMPLNIAGRMDFMLSLSRIPGHPKSSFCLWRLCGRRI